MKKITLAILTALLISQIEAEEYIMPLNEKHYKNKIQVIDKNGNVKKPESIIEIDKSFYIKSCSHWHCYGEIRFGDITMNFGSSAWNMVVIDPKDDSLVLSKSYSTFTDINSINIMIEDINNINSGHFVMIGTQDEPDSNTWQLQNTIKTKLNAENSTNLQYRGVYIYAGYKDGSVLFDVKQDSWDRIGIEYIEVKKD